MTDVAFDSVSGDARLLDISIPSYWRACCGGSIVAISDEIALRHPTECFEANANST
jgi:hypothetical protein